MLQTKLFSKLYYMHRGHFDLLSSETSGDVRKEVVQEFEASLQGPRADLQIANLVLYLGRLDEPSVENY